MMCKKVWLRDNEFYLEDLLVSSPEFRFNRIVIFVWNFIFYVVIFFGFC